MGKRSFEHKWKRWCKEREEEEEEIEISIDFVMPSHKTKATAECINEAARFNT